MSMLWKCFACNCGGNAMLTMMCVKFQYGRSLEPRDKSCSFCQTKDMLYVKAKVSVWFRPTNFPMNRVN